MENQKEIIPFEDFKKLDIRIGRVEKAERIPDTDKLLLLVVNVGDGVPRTIVSGIATFITNPVELVGQLYPFVLNLPPRLIRGHESQGMLLAASSKEGEFAFLMPSRELPPGSELR